MPDVIALIERDHLEVQELFAKFGMTGEGLIARRICDAIERHAAAEERAVYPIVAAELPNGRQMAGEGDEEHAEARQLIARIRRNSDPGRLGDLVGMLEIEIEQHIDVEETEVLPQVRAVLEPARRPRLITSVCARSELFTPSAHSEMMATTGDDGHHGQPRSRREQDPSGLVHANIPSARSAEAYPGPGRREPRMPSARCAPRQRFRA